MKYLIAGLGNIGEEYNHTRHNVGFAILDAHARASNVVFEDRRYGFIGSYRYRGRQVFLLKPSTYVNLSGRAVNYWLKKEKIPLEHLLVVVDDISLPFGTIRLRKKGGPGGHNGLAHINQILGTSDYARFRFGIGSEFPRGAQVQYVLGEWTREEWDRLGERFEMSGEVIHSFVFHGIEHTMNHYNNR